MAGWQLWVWSWLLPRVLGPGPAQRAGHRGGGQCGRLALHLLCWFGMRVILPMPWKASPGGRAGPIKATEIGRGLCVPLPLFSAASLIKSRSPWGKEGQRQPPALAQQSLQPAGASRDRLCCPEGRTELLWPELQGGRLGVRQGTKGPGHYILAGHKPLLHPGGPDQSGSLGHACGGSPPAPAMQREGVQLAAWHWPSTVSREAQGPVICLQEAWRVLCPGPAASGEERAFLGVAAASEVTSHAQGPGLLTAMEFIPLTQSLGALQGSQSYRDLPRPSGGRLVRLARRHLTRLIARNPT